MIRPSMTLSKDIVVLNPIDCPRKRVLVLGYDRSQTRIIDALIIARCEVHYSRDAISVSDYDLVVSFGYRHRITKKIIDQTRCPILNLHISYLPFNRGAHPNFWSFFEETPKGVTIHLVDDGMDTGPIVFQKRVDFAIHNLTFIDTYNTLIREVEDLFLQNLEDILEVNWTAIPQRSLGTIHRSKDLPSSFRGWASIIEDEIQRLREEIKE